jgi:hypothetical protein
MIVQAKRRLFKYRSVNWSKQGCGTGQNAELFIAAGV